MSSYIGRHAELYDLFYADKPYQEEATFINYCLKTYGIGPNHSLLELASGTGTHALFLEKFGYDIIATDHSEDMLACARNKARQAGSNIVFKWQDMRDINLAEDSFDAVICLFDSIGYVTTNEALKKVLDGVYRYTRPNGLFIFEFWHAGAMLRSYDPIRVRRWATPQGDLLRISETVLDCARQLCHVTYTIYELRNDQTYISLKEVQTNRYFLQQEMAGWLERSGFEAIKWFAGFAPDENITENTWHIVCVARRLTSDNVEQP